MSSYYHYNTHQHPTSANGTSSHGPHHSGRSRRTPRVAASQNPHKQQFRGARGIKEQPDSEAVALYRQKFEAARSFDLDDDLEFCSALLTESDMMSLHSSSDRSSLSSGSPESSPTQQAQQVAPAFLLSSTSNPYIPSIGYQNRLSSSIKIQQPIATRAIPIVDPSTGIIMPSMPSPPPSASPARMQQTIGRR